MRTEEPEWPGRAPWPGRAGGGGPMSGSATTWRLARALRSARPIPGALRARRGNQVERRQPVDVFSPSQRNTSERSAARSRAAGRARGGRRRAFTSSRPAPIDRAGAGQRPSGWRSAGPRTGDARPRRDTGRCGCACRASACPASPLAFPLRRQSSAHRGLRQRPRNSRQAPPGDAAVTVSCTPRLAVRSSWAGHLQFHDHRCRGMRRPGRG